MILGGDLNIPREDTSLGTSSALPSLRKQMVPTLQGARLVDVWRLLHSGEREYSYYSPVHKSYSQIDLYLISQLHSVAEITIGAITWSDHAPILLKYNMLGSRGPNPALWRFNESLLQDPEMMEEVLKEVSCYFQNNHTTECTE